MDKARLDCLKHYGGDPPRCLWCGQTDTGQLQLDHVLNDGGEHRRLISTKMETWLRQHDYPPEIALQVLCQRCHRLKRKRVFLEYYAMSPAESKAPKNFYLRRDIIAQLDALAKAKGLSASQVIEDLVLSLSEDGQQHQILAVIHQRHTELTFSVHRMADELMAIKATMGQVQYELDALHGTLKRLNQETLPILIDGVKRVETATKSRWYHRWLGR